VQLRGAVCFLVINRIQELPRVAILSALNNTDLPILVGYISEPDIEPLRDLPIEFVRILESQGTTSQGDYSAFDQDDFYQIVMNKWSLLLQCLPNYDFLIYSDIDVIWLNDASAVIHDIFLKEPGKDVAIQSFGSNEGSPNLCMGFIGLRHSTRALEFLNTSSNRHRDLIVENPRIGDDDVATLVIRESNYPSWLHKLSSFYFPVGNILNLYTSKSTFPGLSAPSPFIFHLNYVVGLTNKRLMLKILAEKNPQWGIESRLTLQWKLLLTLKRMKFFLGTLKESFQ